MRIFEHLTHLQTLFLLFTKPWVEHRTLYITDKCYAGEPQSYKHLFDTSKHTVNHCYSPVSKTDTVIFT